MLRERARTIAALLFFIELLLLCAAFVFAHEFRSGLLPRLAPVSRQFYPLEKYLPLLPLVLLFWGGLLLRSRLYRSHRTVPLAQEALGLLKVCVGGAVLLTLTVYFFRLDAKLLAGDKISRAWIALLAGLSFAMLLAERLVIRGAARYFSRRGLNFRTVLIVGTSEAARAVADSIDRHRYWGYRIIGFLTREEAETAETVADYPVLGYLSEVLEIVEKEAIDEVIVAVSRLELHLFDKLLTSLQEQGICVRFALEPPSPAHGRLTLQELDGLPMLSFSRAPSAYFQLLVKRTVDILVSSLLLLLTLPLVTVISLLIKVTSPGPVLFRQRRLGLNGRRFTMLKFRTMIEDAEIAREQLNHLNEMTGPVFKIRRDPRVTPVGRVLRRFSLDEIPQLLNVLKGDMSLVGPRPPLPEESEGYHRWQRRRLSMRPGITCLWQVRGRNRVDFDKWVELDLEYIDNWSPVLDLKILLLTIPVVLSGRGAS